MIQPVFQWWAVDGGCLTLQLKPCGIQEGTQLKFTESPAGTESSGGRLAFARFCMLLPTCLFIDAEGDDAELFQRLTVAVEQIHAHRQLGFRIHPDDIAVARAIAGATTRITSHSLSAMRVRPTEIKS